MRIVRLIVLALAALVIGAAAPLPVQTGEGWHANYFPNVELTTHEGKKVRFYDDILRGKVVALLDRLPSMDAAARTAIFDQMAQSHIDFMLSKIPMNRFVTVDEVASLVCWLASEDCAFSTGGVFDISGGRATY